MFRSYSNTSEYFLRDYVAIAMAILRLVKTCCFHVWRYHVYARKLTWYFTGVYISVVILKLPWTDLPNRFKSRLGGWFRVQNLLRKESWELLLNKCDWKKNSIQSRLITKPQLSFVVAYTRYSTSQKAFQSFHLILIQVYYLILQFVHFARSYNITPSVLISASHSTTESGNSAPIHNGITTWIEVKRCFWV